MELSQLEREKGQGAASAGFPNNTKLLGFFSVNDKSTHLGNICEKQMHLLPALLTRLMEGMVMLPHSLGKGRALVILTHSGLRAGISLGQQLWCLGREQERQARARER